MDVIAEKRGAAFLDEAFRKSDFNILENNWKKVEGDDENKKQMLETAFRSFLFSTVVPLSDLSDPDLEGAQLLVEFAINACRGGFSQPTLPSIVLSDLMEVLALEHCQILFESIERNVGVWKEDLFFVSVKNNLLRLCNDLLRRLSRTQNTVFYGRILLFLAKFFPISERSGLNVISEFNLDNTTEFNEDAHLNDTSEKESIVIEEDEKNLNIDYTLYRKFWQLQDFFRNPTQCYERIKWKTFTTYGNDVLNTFLSFKLDSVAGKRKRDQETSTVKQGTEQFFAKYLTNQNLLQLQLSDADFRRYILLQFLILFQYLQSSVKFKGDSEVLSDEQTRWINDARNRVYVLIRETPPNGEDFLAAVRHILHREEHWISWKNDGCPPFTSQSGSAATASVKAEASSPKKSGILAGSRKRKRKLGDQIQDAVSNKKFLMGNFRLTNLWNLCPDNMEACSAPERDFLPGLDDYFLEAIEQLNPDNQIEEDYKKVNNGAWGWRALRLLGKKSPYFFTYGNNPIAKLPDYLEQMLKKMCKDSSIFAGAAATAASSSLAGLAAAAAAAAAGGDKAGATPGKNTSFSSANGDSNGSTTPGNGHSSSSSSVCSGDFLAQLGGKLSENWRKLVPKLGLTKDQQDQIEKGSDAESERARALLKKWAELEGEGATYEEIVYVLEGLKMGHLVEGIAQA